MIVRVTEITWFVNKKVTGSLENQNNVYIICIYNAAKMLVYCCQTAGISIVSTLNQTRLLLVEEDTLFYNDVTLHGKSYFHFFSLKMKNSGVDSICTVLRVAWILAHSSSTAVSHRR